MKPASRATNDSPERQKSLSIRQAIVLALGCFAAGILIDRLWLPHNSDAHNKSEAALKTTPDACPPDAGLGSFRRRLPIILRLPTALSDEEIARRYHEREENRLEAQGNELSDSLRITDPELRRRIVELARKGCTEIAEIGSNFIKIDPAPSPEYCEVLLLEDHPTNLIEPEVYANLTPEEGAAAEAYEKKDYERVILASDFSNVKTELAAAVTSVPEFETSGAKAFVESWVEFAEKFQTAYHQDDFREMCRLIEEFGDPLPNSYQGMILDQLKEHGYHFASLSFFLEALENVNLDCG